MDFILKHINFCNSVGFICIMIGFGLRYMPIKEVREWEDLSSLVFLLGGFLFLQNFN